MLYALAVLNGSSACKKQRNVFPTYENMASRPASSFAIRSLS
jgi:hypothetical protein